MRTQRLGGLLAIAVTSVMLLSGCAGDSGFSDLDRERESGDELPVLPDYATESIDLESSRYVGDHGGTSVWLARGIAPNSVCIVAVPDDGDWVAGCGGGGLRVHGAAGDFAVVSDGADPPEAATQISENVYTHE